LASFFFFSTPKKSPTLYLKIRLPEGWGHVEVVECLFRKNKALNSNPNTAKEKK
jgi:hypothetical protein